MRVVKEEKEDLLRGSFGIALAEAMYREGITGKFLVIHSESSEVVRVSPEGPIIYARALKDRTLSGEVLRFGWNTPAYKLLGVSFLRDRRFPIVAYDGPKLYKIDEEDELGLKERVRDAIELILKTNAIDYVISEREIPIIERDAFEYDQAEKLVKDLSLELLDKFEDAH